MAFNGPMAVPAQAVRMPKISMQETDASPKPKPPLDLSLIFIPAERADSVASV